MGGKDYWSVTRVKYRLRILWSVRWYLRYWWCKWLCLHIYCLLTGHTVFELMFMPCLFAGCWVVFDCFSLLGFLPSKFLTFFALKLSDLLHPRKRTWTLKKRRVSNKNLIFPSIVCPLPAVPFVLRGIGQFEVVSFDRSREDESKSGGARDQIYRRLGRIFPVDFQPFHSRCGFWKKNITGSQLPPLLSALKGYSTVFVFLFLFGCFFGLGRWCTQCGSSCLVERG